MIQLTYLLMSSIAKYILIYEMRELKYCFCGNTKKTTTTEFNVNSYLILKDVLGQFAAF